MVASKVGPVRSVPPFYVAVIEEFRRRKDGLGWSFPTLDRRAGTTEGHASHAFTPATPTGRVAQWRTMSDLAEALYGPGYRMIILPADDPLGPVLDACLAGRRAQMVAAAEQDNTPPAPTTPPAVTAIVAAVDAGARRIGIGTRKALVALAEGAPRQKAAGLAGVTEAKFRGILDRPEVAAALRELRAGVADVAGVQSVTVLGWLVEHAASDDLRKAAGRRILELAGVDAGAAAAA